MPYLKVNDIKIHYELLGQGKPVLFIHGLGSSTRDWEYQTPYFSKNYQVLLVDLRGHGQTDKPNHPYSVSLFASDIAHVISTLFPEGVHVVGHSLGGMVAFQLTVDYPNLVKSLTIVNSGPAVIFPSIKSQLFFYLRFFDVRLFGMSHMSKNLAKMLFPEPNQKEFRETFEQRWCENDPKAYTNSLKAFRGWTVMHRLPSITCPTLIISADKDYTPISYKEYYTKLITNAKLKVIENSRHITIIDQADIFNEMVDDFLKSQ
ncbi:MAG: alpha/beta fold hydrolase [Candidatus Berkiella sp.]